VSQLDYDIVVATRNRPEALALSLPLMLRQSRPARALFVVDSSDDPAPVAALVERLGRDAATPVTLVRSDVGLTRQRNVGLGHVEAPVVMFPDDDALWPADCAERIMRVYERDEEGLLGGVCAAESPTPPPQAPLRSDAGYRMTLRDRVNQRVAVRRARLERRLAPNPFELHGWERLRALPAPAWLGEEDAVLTPWMTGFRMTFRTDVVRRVGFDETFERYGQFEDVDACFGVLRTHALAGARRARVFHYRAPSGRGDGFQMGVKQALDRAYVLAKHCEPGSAAWRAYRPYMRYKLGLYLLGLGRAYGRERLRGARCAVAASDLLFQAPRDQLAQAYRLAWRRCLEARQGSSG